AWSRTLQFQAEFFNHRAKLAYLVGLRILAPRLHAQRPGNSGMHVDAVASACSIVLEAKGKEQPLEIAEGDRAPPLHHTIEHFVRLRHCLSPPPFVDPLIERFRRRSEALSPPVLLVEGQRLTAAVADEPVARHYLCVRPPIQLLARRARHRLPLLLEISYLSFCGHGLPVCPSTSEPCGRLTSETHPTASPGSAR